MTYIKFLSFFFALMLTGQIEDKSVINIKAVGFKANTTIEIQVQNDKGAM